ncbi:hypothetical protein FA95DRAFT_1556029 [Auriscalpium vulgare]|uniref:Uncharacterized protein n=1 Tax=Auriscalpium vulgare TaxID=40419 RepID=A0ACB8S184_9AGAM|nr:hypothetical protein FA95DRAFT_1556029 [Auriscalpium vulgare]
MDRIRLVGWLSGLHGTLSRLRASCTWCALHPVTLSQLPDSAAFTHINIVAALLANSFDAAKRQLRFNSSNRLDDAAEDQDRSHLQSQIRRRCVTI